MESQFTANAIAVGLAFIGVGATVLVPFLQAFLQEGSVNKGKWTLWIFGLLGVTLMAAGLSFFLYDWIAVSIGVMGVGWVFYVLAPSTQRIIGGIPMQLHWPVTFGKRGSRSASVAVNLQQDSYKSQLAGLFEPSENGVQRARRASDLLHQETIQALSPTHFIWAVLRPVSLTGVGIGPGKVDYFWVRLRLISLLNQPLTFIRIRAEVKMNGSPMGWWVDFNSAHRTLEYNKKWCGDEKVRVGGSDLEVLVQRAANHETVSLDVVLTLPDGKELSIKNVQEEPYAEGQPDGVVGTYS